LFLQALLFRTNEPAVYDYHVWYHSLSVTLWFQVPPAPYTTPYAVDDFDFTFAAWAVNAFHDVHLATSHGRVSTQFSPGRSALDSILSVWPVG
jgi:hypothetical protein